MHLAISGGQADARTQLIGALHEAAAGAQIEIDNLVSKTRVALSVPDTLDCLIVLAEGELQAEDLGRLVTRLPATTGLVVLMSNPYVLQQPPDDMLVLESRNLPPPLILRAVRQAICLRGQGAVRHRQPLVRLPAPVHALFDDLATFVQVVRRARELPQVFSSVSAICRRALGAAGMVSAMPSDGDGQARLVYTDGFAESALEQWDPAPSGPATPLSDALRGGELVVLDSQEAFRERYAELARRSQPQVQSLVCAPFSIGESGFGAIGVGFDERREFSEHERQFLEVVCQHMADVIAKFRLAQTAADTRRAARVALRDREAFLATAAHELRTPLTLILGQAQLMQRRLAPGDTQSERSLDSIVGQAQRLSRLMTSMVSVFQLEDGSLELKQLVIDLGDLVTSVVHEAQRIFEQQRIVLLPWPQRLQIIGDPMYLEQIIHQILQNAARYSSPQSEIVVELKQAGDQAVLLVRDQGSGVPVAQMAELFQRFSRALEQPATHRRGLGIGLYLVREVVERHGGVVTVESVPEHGSQFSISLPLAAIERA
jgi:signal transduction histidine kinase